jgi:hypothetical protein
MGRRMARKKPETFIARQVQYYASVPLQNHHYKLARDWIGMFSFPLKPLDSLHLAICSSEGMDIVSVIQIRQSAVVEFHSF